ncbi:TPA_asm: hypothetical protein [Powellomyces chytrid fungus MELD virus 4]|nr:TPA_asm: hypothetical protein [Powellomyces chytrid fungus MELD virus 4]
MRNGGNWSQEGETGSEQHFIVLETIVLSAVCVSNRGKDLKEMMLFDESKDDGFIARPAHLPKGRCAIEPVQKYWGRSINGCKRVLDSQWMCAILELDEIPDCLNVYQIEMISLAILKEFGRRAPYTIFDNNRKVLAQYPYDYLFKAKNNLNDPFLAKLTSREPELEANAIRQLITTDLCGGLQQPFLKLRFEGRP